MTITISENIFPLFHPTMTEDLKDPCPVFDGETWHVFGSSGTVKSETWNILHATAPDLCGLWTEHAPVRLPISGSGVAAPGVIFDAGVFHMFVQTEFMKPGGRCEHAVSNDGFSWVVLQPAILSLPGSGEDGIYDPHPAMIGGHRYIVYSGMPPFTRVPSGWKQVAFRRMRPSGSSTSWPTGWRAPITRWVRCLPPASRARTAIQP